VKIERLRRWAEGAGGFGIALALCLAGVKELRDKLHELFGGEFEWL
jgi:hypothetical protein